MITFTKYFKHYLLGREFILRTDHNSLRWLHNFQGLEGQVARWVEQLANFQYKIVHRPGKAHTNADALSRLSAFMDPEGEVEGSQGESAVRAIEVQLVPPPQENGQEPPPQEGSQEVSQIGEQDELSQAQMEDQELRHLIDLKKSGVELVGHSIDPVMRKYASVWPQLDMRGPRLVRVLPVNPTNPSDAPLVQVVLPRALVPKVLSQLHNTTTGGHLGVQKLQGKVKDRFYWLGWAADVKQWCRECRDCGSRKMSGKQPCAPLQSTFSAT